MDPGIFLQSQSDHYVMRDCENNDKIENFDLFDVTTKYRTQILPAQCSSLAEYLQTRQKDELSNMGSSKKLSSLMAGKKARERKKKYVESMEFQVGQIEKQLAFYEQQIKKTKETLAQALNSTKNNQNSITYSELQLCVQSEDPNEDKINLLLDMIKYRIGASGHERQAKIQYFFKQLINTLFPAIHRYLMFCSDKNLDFFVEHTIDEFFQGEPNETPIDDFLTWTRDFIVSLDLTDNQKNQLIRMKPKYLRKKEQIKRIISYLKQIKESIKSQEAVYESLTDEIRNGLKPVQGAIWVLLTDKFKYKKQINLQSQIQLFSSTQNLSNFPTKKRKLE